MDPYIISIKKGALARTPFINQSTNRCVDEPERVNTTRIDPQDKEIIPKNPDGPGPSRSALPTVRARIYDRA